MGCRRGHPAVPLRPAVRGAGHIAPRPTAADPVFTAPADGQILADSLYISR